MKFTIAQVSEKPTENGNLIVKLSIDEMVETGLGKERRAVSYYKAVEAESIKVAEGDEVELDIADYNVVERPFEHPESGDILQLKWLHLK